jgi:coenzyme F420-reducing hydrogenase beta subunit
MSNLDVPNCTGCAACVNICPHGAIAMHANSEGFDYPSIQEDTCKDCGLCKKTCPVLSQARLPKFREVPAVYAAWHRDLETRMQSSSGGAFSALASRALEQGGIVFGAAFDADFLVYHKSINSEEGMGELRRSKYVQSRIGNTFRELKQYLDEGRKVLFVGTSCQTAGLHAYLGRTDDNLASVALVCLGAPSPKVFNRYLKSIERMYGDSIVSYSFRDKRNGWACNEAIRLANGEEIVRGERADSLPSYYYAFSQKVLLSRISCYACPFKGLPGYADIILGDFWSIRRQEPKWDDGKGTSMVLVNSDKGEMLLHDSQKYLTTKSCPFRYVQFNGNLMRPARCPKDRAKLFADLDKIPFDELARKYMRQPGAAVMSIKKVEQSLKMMVKKAIGMI